MASSTDKKLIILTTENDKLIKSFEKELDYKKDKRIIFTSSVYDLELLKKIREQAYAYIQGHEVGGTNPSLLEGLASTDLNLVYGVKFNREVAGEAAFYWKKSDGNLTQLINKAEQLGAEKIEGLGFETRKRTAIKYDWEKIVKEYVGIFS